jgi:hypothetical protein
MSRDDFQAASLPLLRGSTTLEAALGREENMLLNLAYPEQRLDFFVWLNTHRRDKRIQFRTIWA